jgi:ankyrin repeat protein
VIIAIKEGNYERALSIIYAGEDEEGRPFDVNAKDAHGGSALMYACVADQPNIVRALLEAGAEMRVCGLPLEHLSQRTQAALRVGFCATFATETLHWWMAPRIERIMRCPSPIGELVLGYTGRMAAFPEDIDPTDPPTLAFRLAPKLGVDCTPSSSASASSSSSSSSPSSSC